MLGLVFGVFAVLMFLGISVAASLGLATFIPQFMDPGFIGDANYILRAVVSGLDSTSILAVPLFMLSGAVMARGGISRKLFDVFAVFIGNFRAGMPCAVVITCLFYGAISGSGVATCAAVGGMCIPVLLDLGYDKKFAGAIVAAASSLGIIIPPSIPMVLYGINSNGAASVGDLFKGGVFPGILIGLCLMLYCIIFCKKNGEDREKIRASVAKLRERGYLHVLKDGFWALMTPVIILGSIYSGICTPTEAACISVFYALIVSIFIYKSMKPSEILGQLKGAVASYAPLCLMVAFAVAFGRIMSLLDVPSMLADVITQYCANFVVFLLALNFVLFILGMFMDTTSAIIILTPMLLTTATGFGINPVHFGIILIVNLALGMISPPIGINIFVAAPLIDVSSGELGKKILLPMLFFILALLIITFVPALSLALL
ncbi:MAG: TRAP transporter large permease [Lachnospiraceae bacterium]|nr:TRAP transporter large permease [Lachnospiraceae bacterium]